MLGIECVHDMLVDIPLPAVESAIDLAFADLDGDGDDELISIGKSSISVISSDGSIVLTPWPEPIDYATLTPLELQGDGLLDLALTTVDGGIHLFAGTLEGEFSALAIHPTVELEAVRAIDPESDGIDQLVAIQTDSRTLTWFSDVLAGTSMELDFEADTLTIADVSGGGMPEIIIDRGCAASALDAIQFQVGLERRAGGNHCDWHAEALVDDYELAAVATSPDYTTATQLNLFQTAELQAGWTTAWSTMLPNMSATASTLVHLTGASEPELALASTTNLALIWDWNQFPTPACNSSRAGPSAWSRATTTATAGKS
ncbi:hypothetical protein ACNOYE_37755 [Nannocystaceae bacterium ST9]